MMTSRFFFASSLFLSFALLSVGCSKGNHTHPSARSNDNGPIISLPELEMQAIEKISQNQNIARGFRLQTTQAIEKADQLIADGIVSLDERLMARGDWKAEYRFELVKNDPVIALYLNRLESASRGVLVDSLVQKIKPLMRPQGTAADMGITAFEREQPLLRFAIELLDSLYAEKHSDRSKASMQLSYRMQSPFGQWIQNKSPILRERILEAIELGIESRLNSTHVSVNEHAWNSNSEMTERVFTKKILPTINSATPELPEAQSSPLRSFHWTISGSASLGQDSHGGCRIESVNTSGSQLINIGGIYTCRFGGSDHPSNISISGFKLNRAEQYYHPLTNGIRAEIGITSSVKGAELRNRGNAQTVGTQFQIIGKTKLNPCNRVSECNPFAQIQFNTYSLSFSQVRLKIVSNAVIGGSIELNPKQVYVLDRRQFPAEIELSISRNTQITGPSEEHYEGLGVTVEIGDFDPWDELYTPFHNSSKESPAEVMSQIIRPRSEYVGYGRRWVQAMEKQGKNLNQILIDHKNRFEYGYRVVSVIDRTLNQKENPIHVADRLELELLRAEILNLIRNSTLKWIESEKQEIQNLLELSPLPEVQRVLRVAIERPASGTSQSIVKSLLEYRQIRGHVYNLQSESKHPLDLTTIDMIAALFWTENRLLAHSEYLSNELKTILLEEAWLRSMDHTH